MAHKCTDLPHNPYCLWASQTLHSRGQNQQWSTSGQIGYITLAVWGVPQCFRSGEKIRSGPQVGGLATQACNGCKILHFFAVNSCNFFGRQMRAQKKLSCSVFFFVVNTSTKLSCCVIFFAVNATMVCSQLSPKKYKNYNIQWCCWGVGIAYQQIRQ